MVLSHLSSWRTVVYSNCIVSRQDSIAKAEVANRACRHIKSVISFRRGPRKTW